MTTSGDRDTEVVHPSILIVDDDLGSIHMLDAMLADLGRILFATNGPEALELVRATPPDLVLLDAEMPGMSGFDVCAAMQGDPILSEVPIIFVTGFSEREYETRALDAGAVDFILKPFNSPVVRRRVKTQIALKQKSDELRWLASVDGLTRLPNRRTFDQRLDEEWRRGLRTGQPLSLAMIDVDHFKRYNDRYGHIAGDECLKAVAAAIRNVARRSSDLVARYGGEEFAAILTATGGTIAAVLAERMGGKVTELGISNEASDISSVVTVSIGMATVTYDDVANSPGGSSQKAIAHSVHESALVALADEALYSAKSTGRNKIVGVVRRISELAVTAGAEVTHNKPSYDHSSR
ncbi:MAG: diguanylate cyclase domain-containing protein [Alphaproteobacteria bacterium]